MRDKETLINEMAIELSETVKTVRELKDYFIEKLYEFSFTHIQSTDVSTTDGSATLELFEYFRIGKLSSNKSDETINQYKRVVFQLCRLAHKELNLITSDDVNNFLVVYKRMFNIADCTMESKRLYLSSVFTYLLSDEQMKNALINVGYAA